MQNRYLAVSIVGLFLIVLPVLLLDGGAVQYALVGIGLILAAFAAFRLLTSRQREGS